MRNKFVANIILCKNITEDNKIESVFNNLEIYDDDSEKIDVAIFLTAEITQPTKEMFLVNLIFKDDAEGVKYKPLGTFVKEYNSIGKTYGINLLRNNMINFVGSGLYDLELRRCKEHKNINALDNEEILDFIEKSDLVNSFTFNVELK